MLPHVPANLPGYGEDGRYVSLPTVAHWGTYCYEYYFPSLYPLFEAGCSQMQLFFFFFFFFFSFLSSISPSPGSYMGRFPLLSPLIFFTSESTQRTLWPCSARQVPATRPTYPHPTQVMFIP